MESLPVEILTQILYRTYGPCLADNKQLSGYVKGALVCSLWRDILYNHKNYIITCNAINAVVSLPWDEQYVSIVSIIKAHLISWRNILQSKGYNVKYSIEHLNARRCKNIELVIGGKNNSTIRISHMITSSFISDRQHTVDVIDDMNNIVDILRG